MTTPSSENHDKKPLIDVISFTLGGLLFSLLSAVFTVLFIKGTDSLYKLAMGAVAVFVLVCIVMVVYLIKRGKIWQTLVGSNIYNAQENLADSIKVLINYKSDKDEDEQITQKDAIQNLTAIYGDFQVRRFIIFCVLAAFGAISALLTAAFLIKQTNVMDRQTEVMNKQTELAKDISKTESLYQPYWNMKHADSVEIRRSAFTALLQQQDTTNFSGIRLEQVDFRPRDGSLDVQGFRCNSCSYRDVQFGRVNWTGDIAFYNTFLIRTTFSGGKMVRPILYNVHINNLSNDDAFIATDGKTNLFAGMNIERFVFRKSEMIQANIQGFEELDLDTFSIEGVEGSLFSHVDFRDLKIEVTKLQEDDDPFDETGFENVRIINSHLSNADLSSVQIAQTLILDNVVLENVTFSENQMSCISFINDSHKEDATWIKGGDGKCHERFENWQAN